MVPDTIGDLAGQWIDSGLRPGSLLLLHSDLRRLLRRLPRTGRHPQAILRSFREALGPDGTLLLPTFCWGFLHGKPFNLASTPSEMGVLTEIARREPDAVRTGHPVFSFVALGARAPEFLGVENFGAFAADSPFAMLRRMDGEIAVLDLPDQHSMTFYHHVEEILEVGYRRHEVFSGPYTGFSGRSEQRTFGMFARNFAQGIKTHVDPMGEILWEKGIYRGDRPGGGSGLRIAPAQGVFDATGEVIRDGRAEGTLFIVGEPEFPR